MYRIYSAFIIIMLFIISCNDKKPESKQYRLNISETNEVINMKTQLENIREQVQNIE